MGGLNRRLLLEKSDVIARCLQRVKAKVPETKESLLSDMDAQDIIILNLERAIQACVDIAAHIIAYTPLKPAATMGESFSLLAKGRIISNERAMRMQKAVGLRNILVYQYQVINWDIIWSVLHHQLGDLMGFVKEIMQTTVDQS